MYIYIGTEKCADWMSLSFVYLQETQVAEALEDSKKTVSDLKNEVRVQCMAVDIIDSHCLLMYPHLLHNIMCLLILTLQLAKIKAEKPYEDMTVSTNFSQNILIAR